MVSLPFFRLLALAPLCALACLASPVAAYAQDGSPAPVLVPSSAIAATSGAETSGVTFAAIPDDAESAPPPLMATSDKLSCNSKMAKLLDDPVARTVLRERIPDVVDSPQISMARGLTLRQLAHFRRAGISQEMLQEIETDLAALP